MPFLLIKYSHKLDMLWNYLCATFSTERPTTTYKSNSEGHENLNSLFSIDDLSSLMAI